MTASARCCSLIATSLWLLAGSIAAEAQTDPGQTIGSPTAVRIGSKSFTESVILGEMLTALARHAGAPAEHRAELGGTQFVWQALLAGEIDAYVDYTGTLKEEILGLESADLDLIREQLAAHGIEMTDPLGFNNTYALGMREERAAELGITKISDLKRYPDLKLGFSDEFIERADGWYGLKAAYGLPHDDVRGLEHTLAYRGLISGAIDVIDFYATDPEIISYGLRVLEDDLGYFPKYEAVICYRRDLKTRYPQVLKNFEKLVGRLDNRTMTQLNKRARVDRIPEPVVAVDFLRDHIDATIEPARQSPYWQRMVANLLRYGAQHVVMVAISLTAAIICSIPLGIWAYKRPRWGEWLLAAVGVIQTIPSLALLVFMIPLLGLGSKPAIVALFLYSLLPIVRGTHAGLQSIAPSIHESARALGLTPWARLRLIELPLASPSIVSGIKTSAVINVGTATIGALIGAGGYGQPILTGIRLADTWLILQGAIPAALLAIGVNAGFTWLERWIIPAGLRLESEKAPE